MRRLVVLLAALLTVAAALAGAVWAIVQDHRYAELVKLGDELLAQKLPFPAGRAYSAAIRLDPDAALAYVKRAEAHRRQGNPPKAISDLERAAERSPDVLQVSMRLAQVYDELGRFEEAARQYERALELDPSAAGVWYQLALVRYRDGREAEAIAALNRAAELRQDFWEAFYLRGAVFRGLGGRDEAETDLVRAIELAPDAALARRALVELYLEGGEADEAMPLVHEEIDADPGASLPYVHLAEAHRISGRTAEAIEAMGLALEQDPDVPDSYRRLGELWLEQASVQGDSIALDKAVAALSTAVKMEPSNGAARLALGRAYVAMGDESRGFAELKRATQSTPIPADAHLLLGDLYRARGNHAESVTAYHIYLMLEGDQPAVLDRLGDAYLDLGKLALAAETYLQLAKLEPGRVTPLAKAARAFLLDGNAGAAAAACRRGLAAHPEHPVLVDLLARAQRYPSGS